MDFSGLDIIDGIGEVFIKYKNLITNLDEVVFIRSFPNSSSVGAHVRHVLDRANCVIEAFDNGHIDYDKRRRKIEMEKSPQLCLKEFDRILSVIKNYSNDLHETILVSESINEQGLKVSVESTFSRELLDIILHMTHHMATLKFILAKSNIEVDKNFGKNPSTIIHEHQ